MNRKGQALIEFVLILPVFIFILFAVIDFGRIFSTKSELENDSSDIVLLYKDGKSVDEISLIYPDNIISVNNVDDYNKIEIKRMIKIMTPGLNLVLGNPYEIKIERIIPDA